MRPYLTRLLLVCISLCTAIFSADAQLFINEFMAANSSAVTDPDNGEYVDWIELYNASSQDVDLGGYFLTDNLSDTMKWMIPSGTIIPANGFLLLWEDGTNAGTHAPFKLSSAGEELGLYDTSLQLLDGLVFSAQQTNISYGRGTDGSLNWSWFTESTPGATNNTSFAYQGITYYQPFFSQTGGFFETQQSVALNALGGTIHYTLDGRAPTINDPVYSSPIVFNTSTFIRARVFEDNFVPGPVITHSYFFDNTLATRGLPVVSLVTDPDFFWDPTIGIYVQDFKPEWEQPLNIELFENDGNNQAVFNMQAGVKINGLYSWQLPQKMLGIYCRSEYGSNSLDYPLFADRERSSYDEFILRASGSDWSFTLFRDGLCQSLIQDNAFVQKQGFRASIVFINGEYMGIHNIRSRSNGEDIEALYDLAPGQYDIISNDGEVEEGSDIQYQEMQQLYNNDLSVTENFQLLSDKVDVVNFADYWMTEIWASNGSWGHNTKMWKPLGTGKWQFLFGDLDRGFVGSSDDAIASYAVPVGNADDYVRNWFDHLFQNESYKSFFAQRFTDHMYCTFHPQRVNEKINPFEARLVPEIAYHVARWTGTTSSYGNGISTVQFWQDQVNALRVFASERQSFMMNDIKNTFGLNNYVNLGTSSLPANGGSIRLNEFKVPGSPWSGPYFTNMPFELSALPNPGYQFQGWSTYSLAPVFGLGENWKFLDNGSDAGNAWTQVDFDDSNWQNGNAELGYGDGDEVTTVSFGPDANNKFITTYFRKEFEYTGDGVTPVSCVLNVRRDDGVVVYLNGAEVARDNMPQGNVNYLTTATTSIGGAGESSLTTFQLNLPLLNGMNVIAIELHQVNGQSSDVSFDASFSAVTISDVIISTDMTLPVVLTEDAGYIARYIPTGACILPQEITVNTTLTVDCSPYIASGDTRVLPDISLVVEPGVEIWFPENARLIVQGDLQVQGTESQPVLFKANTDYGAQSWGNVSFENCTAINHLHYLELKQATEGAHPVHNRAAISGWFSEIEMDHVSLTDNFSNPIFGEYSSFHLTNSVIHSSVSGDLINVKYGEGYISDCTFIGNDQPDTDAVDYDRVEDGIIRNSVIQNMHGFNSDGVDIGEECQNVVIENCLIHDCTDKGISCGQSSTAVALNNTIVNCNLGLGIKDLGEVQINHCTFYSDVYGVACFEKNPGLGGGLAMVNNCIISNSSGSPVSFDSVSELNAINNYYDTDTMEGQFNYWFNPLFVNPTEYDFHLENGSPAIDAGMDNEDMGTLFHEFNSGPRIMISDIQYVHALNADQEFIRILNPANFVVDISGYSLTTAIDFVFPEGTMIAPGEKITVVKDIQFFPSLNGQVFVWTNGQLNNAGEMILLLDENGIIIDHVLYDDVAPWPIVTETQQSIQLISPVLDNHFASSWVAVDPDNVPDLSSVSTIQVYPNPASDRIVFMSSDGINTIDIYDGAGRTAFRHAMKTGKMVELDIQSLPEGIYVAVVNSTYQTRFVVMK